MPTVLRLSDEAETSVNLARPDAVGSQSSGGCLMITGYEGTAAQVAALAREVLAHARVKPFVIDIDDTVGQTYGYAKKGAEAMCYTSHYLHGIDVTVVRYFTVYGPAGRPDMSLFRFVQWISEGLAGYDAAEV